MASVRITGNWRSPNKMEWGGVAGIDKAGRIERSIQIPEPVYEAMEKAIAKGQIEGEIRLQDGTRFQWLLDR
jgi:hypothetical protein